LDARDECYEAWGYPPAKSINSFTAHGIGVDSLEPPWIPGKERIMQENMIINTHPAVSIPDPEKGAMLGGISIADNVLVTADGPVRMVDQVDEWIVLDC
ncbi:MAG: M24 family metallopeptidase, partial [bacterium]|nr:M24 family metallopeptidase [bacterium]